MPSSWRSASLLLFVLFALQRALCAPAENQSAAASGPTPPPDLHRIIISDTKDNAVQLARNAAPSDRVRSSLPLLQGRALAAALAPFVGAAMDRPRWRELGEAVATFVRQRDFPVVHVHIPDISGENLPAGTACLIVTLGRYSAIAADGLRFSSRESMLGELGIATGDEVRLSQLGAAVDWLNTNPFRSAESTLRDTGEGWTRLELSLQEQRPYRAVAVYDNHGTVYTGRSRYTAALHAGDLWRARHQLYYEFTRTKDPQHYQSHALDYRVPLPWRGYFIVEAAYSAVRPELAGSNYTSKGRNFVGSLRHVLHHRLGTWSGALSTGLGFKAIRNDLAFGGAPYLVDGHPFQNFHVHQLSLSETVRRYDARGSWWFSFAAHLSPGGVDSRNGNMAFARSRTGAVARYGYATLVAQRLTTLPHALQLYTRALSQASTGRLLASEQMWLGGAATLRGYPERAYPGDAAWAITQELRSPAWSYPARLLGAEHACQLQVLSFLDAGRSYARHATDSDTREPVLLSAGAGLRGRVGQYFDVTFDYGWPLRRSANLTSAPGGRGQVQARLFF
ncbi:MAG TPA: ShlB/FhaC/HecB family hemolysin secretion/activation protein [Opitutaceae bacterium]